MKVAVISAGRPGNVQKVLEQLDNPLWAGYPCTFKYNEEKKNKVVYRARWSKLCTY